MNSAPAASPASYLDLSYRPDIQLLTARWLRAVSFAEIQTGFQEILHLSRQHRATRWLIDIRRRTELDADSSAWVAHHLLPEAAAAVAPGMLAVAYLLSPARMEALQSDTALRQVTALTMAPTQAYRLQTFLDEGPAVAWLLAQ